MAIKDFGLSYLPTEGLHEAVYLFWLSMPEFTLQILFGWERLCRLTQILPHKVCRLRYTMKNGDANFR